MDRRWKRREKLQDWRMGGNKTRQEQNIKWEMNKIERLKEKKTLKNKKIKD